MGEKSAPDTAVALANVATRSSLVPTLAFAIASQDIVAKGIRVAHFEAEPYV
jgi:hypothetical protein